VFIKEFRTNVIIRVIIISSVALILAYVLTNKTWFFTPLVLVILLVLFIGNLIYYIEKTNKDITLFILSIKQGGFTSSFPTGQRGNVYRKLSEAFNDVIEEFRKLNLQKETHYQYLQTLTENIQVGIVSYDLEGNVMLVNPAARQLLQILRIVHTRELKQVNAKLYQTVQAIEPGQRQLIRVMIANREVRLSIQAKELVMDDKAYRVILMQDLNIELEEQEVDAWQKLIRVLTHEIMNSVTPIVSLTESLNTLLAQPDGARKPLSALDEEDKEDLYSSLQTIENRSKGLLRFVNAYKDFSKTPELMIKPVDVTDLIGRVVKLLEAELGARGIVVEKTIPGYHLSAHADGEWIEQVLINVLKNSMEALEGKEDGRIEISASQVQGKTYIIVRDNGQGMDKTTLDQVFVPFFTTKKKGTGIGLSLSRQIMRLHRGQLSIRSKEGLGTEVELIW